MSSQTNNSFDKISKKKVELGLHLTFTDDQWREKINLLRAKLISDTCELLKEIMETSYVKALDSYIHSNNIILSEEQKELGKSLVSMATVKRIIQELTETSTTITPKIANSYAPIVYYYMLKIFSQETTPSVTTASVSIEHVGIHFPQKPNVSEILNQLDRNKISAEKGSEYYSLVYMKEILRQIGSKTSGTKSEVSERLLNVISQYQ